MNMKDRLTELIVHAKHNDPETGSFTEFLADYLIENGVTIGAESVIKHGKWIAEYERQGNYSHCSLCNCRCAGYTPNYKFCPNCGAKMDGERK